MIGINADNYDYILDFVIPTCVKGPTGPTKPISLISLISTTFNNATTTGTLNFIRF